MHSNHETKSEEDEDDWYVLKFKNLYVHKYSFKFYFVFNFYSRKSHPLRFENKDAVLAKDANKKDDDWFEIYDPRSALNKRKRQLNKTEGKQDKDKKTKL